MHLRYAHLSSQGPVRPVNEDWLDFWEAQDPLAREEQGSVAAMADGVGGHANGEVASRLAVEEAIRRFQAGPAAAKPYALLKAMFASACEKVHGAAAAEHAGRTMATTLTASLFRNNSVYVANVGDTRAYFIRRREIRRLTRDHVATSVPVRLGLMLERQAMASPDSSRLTRSVGAEAFCQPDFATQFLRHGDFVLHCTDGLHAFVLDEEICDVVARNHPYDSCRELVAMAERRGSGDNISLQLVEIRDWEGVERSARAARGKGAPRSADTSGAAGEPGPGQVLDGRFEITDLVARSNMASIFKARDRESGRTVAVKVALSAIDGGGGDEERFRREEAIGAALDHPYILKVLKVPGKRSRPYLVMEFLEGRTLDRVMAGRRLSEGEARSLAAMICEALAYLHARGIVHRDLKPQNIMVCGDGSLRLIDFGVARVERARRLTFVGLTPAMGTPDYMSPEQVKGRRAGPQSDIYSLGAILYEMVTGSVPFQGESPYVVMNARVGGDPRAPRALNPELHPALEEIILHALERDPRKRFATAADMKRELDDLDQVALTRRDERLKPPGPGAARRRIGILIVGALLLQAALFLLFYLILRR